MNAKERERAKARLLEGLGIGIVFGFALQRSGVSNYDVVLRTLTLQDMTVLKVMMSAVVVGAIGVHWMYRRGIIQLDVRSASVGQTVIGGLIFGVGFGLLGYCPGTTPVAIAEGRLDALIGALGGMLIGSTLFAHAYKDIKPIFSLGHIGQKSLWDVVPAPPWAIVATVCCVICILLVCLEALGV